MTQSTTRHTDVYIGTYTNQDAAPSGRSEGIYLYRMDPTTGGLSHVATTPGVTNPSFLAIDPSRRFLYAVNEVTDFDGQATGTISAFAIHPVRGELSFLNRQPSHGTAPCHVTVDQTGRYVLVANYGSGSVAIYPVQADGDLAPASDIVQHHGSSVNPQRQEGPHAHSITPDPTNRFALVADLGLDRLMVYGLELTHGRLQPQQPPGATVKPGAGPRHLSFHPSGRFAYLINEIDSTMTVFAFDGDHGTLKELQTLPTLPVDFGGTSHCADVHVAPSGKFVYGSNRGHDSIVIYAVDQDTGTLTTVGHEPTRGKTPRNFGIDPSGAYLLAANQATNTVVTFRVDPETGRLTPTGEVAQVPAPVCLQFVLKGEPSQ